MNVDVERDYAEVAQLGVASLAPSSRVRETRRVLQILEAWSGILHFAPSQNSGVFLVKFVRLKVPIPQKYLCT